MSICQGYKIYAAIRFPDSRFYDRKETFGGIFIERMLSSAENNIRKKAGGMKMSIIHTNYIQKSSGSFANAYIKKAEVSYSSSKTAPKESVVEAYKRKHPESAAHVSKQVQAGKKFGLRMVWNMCQETGCRWKNIRDFFTRFWIRFPMILRESAMCPIFPFRIRAGSR